MALTIGRIDDRSIATATPPHADDRWTTSHPIRRNGLKRVLVARGAHLQDVAQLLDEVDSAHKSGKEARASF